MERKLNFSFFFLRRVIFSLKEIFEIKNLMASLIRLFLKLKLKWGVSGTSSLWLEAIYGTLETQIRTTGYICQTEN